MNGSQLSTTAENIVSNTTPRSFTNMSISTYGVIIHAGATESWTTNHTHQQSIEETLNLIAEKAGSQLAAGARAIDVVQDAVAAMETCELFYAGKGAVLNEDGEHEVRSRFSSILKRHH